MIFRTPKGKATERRARDRWLRNHPERRRAGQLRAYAHRYIKIADENDLKKIQGWIDQRNQPN